MPNLENEVKEMNFKALEERRVDLETQMSSIIATAKAEKRSLTSTEETEFAKCENEIREIDETIEREENKMSNTEIREIEQRESKQFVDYIRGAIENRAEGNLATTNNGAIIPKTIANKVIKKAYDMSSILKSATKYNTKGNLSIPVYNEGDDGIAMAYSNEFAELESKSGNFTSIDLGNFLAGALCKISKSLVANTDIDLENTVVNLMAEAIARFQERELLKGTDGKVEGLRGVELQHKCASASVITADDLIRVKNKVKKQFRSGAKWIMSNDTLTAIELLKDKNDRFIFREDVNGEFDGYVLGYPVEVTDNMDDIGSSKDVIFFGDFSGLALKQRSDALELQVLREKFATQHCIGVCAWLEFDAKVEHKQKIAKMTMGA